MGQSKVTVTEIPLDSAKPPILPVFDVDSHGPPPDRQVAESMARRLDEAVHDMQRTPQKAYRLSWNGDAIPHGAIVGGHTIVNLRQGEVISETGETIGTYERFTKSGKEGTTYEANVFLYADPK